MSHEYDLFLRSNDPFQEVDLILPDGGKVHYVRTSSGTGHTDAVFEHSGTPSKWQSSTITWNGNGWDLAMADGSVLVFGNKAPLQRIVDRNGNVTEINRQGDYYGSETGYVTSVVSPNGRWLEFTYDTSNRVSEVADNTGRTVSYTYDASGRLWQVTDPQGGVVEYGYDTTGRMTSITDARGITYLTNSYDASGRVDTQTIAGEGVYDFDYTIDPGSGAVTQTTVTDPRGSIRTVGFNTDGYMISDTYATGTPLEQTVSYERDAATNLAEVVVDQAGRRTEYGYDSLGFVTSVTALAGTPDAVTSSYTYEPTYHQLKTVTDPLNHTTTFFHDPVGNVVRIDDPNGRSIHFDHDGQGQVTSTWDDLNQTTSYSYDQGDLVVVTDPLNNTSTQFVDASGRLVSFTDPQGARTTVAHTPVNLVESVTDPLGQTTSFGYDANGNLTSITDPRSNTVSFEYDDADRISIRRDALAAEDTYSYDPGGNLETVTDRRGVVTTYAYDALGRMDFAGYGQTGPSAYESTITYDYNPLNLIETITDSQAGTITYAYDPLDRLESETTPLGTVGYAYDDAGHRTNMTVSGQTTTTYLWDDADHLQTITRGSSTVGYDYDTAGRLKTVSGPNGVATSYGYDAASQVSSISHTQGGSAVGDLTYIYDQAGRITTTGGSLARTVIPDPVASAVYDPANRITTWDGTTYTWDPAGNLTSDGTAIYTWNARGELANVSDGSSTWNHAYDAVGNRIGLDDGTHSNEYLFDAANPIIEYVDGTVTATLLDGSGLDVHHTRTTGGAETSYLTDLLGSTIGLVDGSGVIADYAYGPYGQTTTTGDTTGNGFAWTGRPSDPDGLYQLRARYYHPDLQRFISEDPLGLAAGPTNYYLYAGNNPINHTDRTGLFDPGTVIDAGFIVYDTYKLFTGGRKNFSSNLGTLGLDILGALIPFVTGLGAASRTARFGDNVASSLPHALTIGRNAERGVDVYQGVKGGKNVYVGITNKLTRRQTQHGIDKFILRPLTTSPVTRGQARAIEEAIIKGAGGTVREGGTFMNIRHSISPDHPWYDQAVEWGEQWLRRNGF
jgi:RHS repeat-associated protein